ncbi:hypothetical protein ACFY36_19385 [Actinoplanes sp. NPDC000266]
MEIDNCGRVMSALMIGLHTAWAVIYQGSPKNVDASAVGALNAKAARRA